MIEDIFGKAAEATLCDSLLQAVRQVPASIRKQITEIRLRTGMPLMLSTLSEPVFLLKSGGIAYHNRPGVYEVTADEMQESFRKICGYSVHSYQNEIKNGFLTVNGNRVGFCGTAVVEDGQVASVRNISSLNVRIAREVRGVAAPIVSAIQREGLQGILIAGAPATGKTTILKDLTRSLANGSMGRYYRVSVVDERAELGGKTNDLGCSSDILTGYPKAQGMEIAIRTLAPDVLVCDEIGSREDIAAVRQAVHAGVKLIAAIHAEDPSDLLQKAGIPSLLDTGAFRQFFFLSSREKGKVGYQCSLEELYYCREEHDRDDQDTGAALSRCSIGDGRDISLLRFVKESI